MASSGLRAPKLWPVPTKNPCGSLKTLFKALVNFGLVQRSTSFPQTKFLSERSLRLGPTSNHGGSNHSRNDQTPERVLRPRGLDHQNRIGPRQRKRQGALNQRWSTIQEPPPAEESPAEDGNG
ncbi:hypothetical protein ACLKA7_001022 [Drosophila subpalustris]